jgi:hypothetical protein
MLKVHSSSGLRLGFDGCILHHTNRAEHFDVINVASTVLLYNLVDLEALSYHVSLVSATGASSTLCVSCMTVQCAVCQLQTMLLVWGEGLIMPPLKHALSGGEFGDVGLDDRNSCEVG